MNFDPFVHTKDRLGLGGNKGIRLLINATKSIDRLRVGEYLGEKFAIIAYPHDERMRKVRKRCEEYGIKVK